MNLQEKLNQLAALNQPVLPENDYYHFCYKTTCLINGKQYIGKHSIKKELYENDYYLGSSSELHRDIEKFTRLNFTREILCFFDTSDEAYDYEAELITEEIISDPDWYNVQPGGSRGSTLFSKWYTNGTKNISLSFGETPPAGFHKGLTVKSVKKRVISDKCNVTGRIWVNNGTKNKLVHEIPDGWTKGRIFNQSGDKNPLFKGWYVTPAGRFATAGEAATANRCSQGSIMNWIKKGKAGFSISPEPSTNSD